MKKRMLSLLLCLVMVLSLLPTVAFAAGNNAPAKPTNLRIEDGNAKCDAVEDATSYTFTFYESKNGKPQKKVNSVDVTDPYTSITNFLNANGSGDYQFDVEAKAGNKKSGRSDPKSFSIYTLTFDMQGHGTPITQKYLSTQQQLTAPTAPSATGYTFVGWFADPFCSVSFSFNAPLTGDTTVYAKWEKTGTISLTKSFVDLPAGVAAPSGTTFTISDSTGAVVQTLSLGQFSHPLGYNPTPGSIVYEIDIANLSAGTYTITETNYAVNNYTANVSFIGATQIGSSASATVSVKAGQISGVAVTNKYTPDSSDPDTPPANPQNPSNPPKPTPPTQPKLDTSPRTGDARQTALWIGMLTLAFGTAAAAIYISRKKEQA